MCFRKQEAKDFRANLVRFFLENEFRYVAQNYEPL